MKRRLDDNKKTMYINRALWVIPKGKKVPLTTLEILHKIRVYLEEIREDLMFHYFWYPWRKALRVIMRKVYRKASVRFLWNMPLWAKALSAVDNFIRDGFFRYIIKRSVTMEPRLRMTGTAWTPSASESVSTDCIIEPLKTTYSAVKVDPSIVEGLIDKDSYINFEKE